MKLHKTHLKETTDELNETQSHSLPAGGAYEQQWYSVSWVTAVNKAELPLWTTIAVSHLEDCVLRRLNPLEIASSVGCVTYTKCPQPRIKRDGLRRTGGKGNRKYHVDLPTHLEHHCASHYLNEGNLFLNLESNNKKKKAFTCFILLNVWGAAAYIQQTSVREKKEDIKNKVYPFLLEAL